MKKICFLLIMTISAQVFAQKMTETKLKYPETKKGTQIDSYFGTQVEDPYRWLEDDRSEETGEWVKKENELTFSYLDAIPYRNTIQNRIQELIKVENNSVGQVIELQDLCYSTMALLDGELGI